MKSLLTRIRYWLINKIAGTDIAIAMNLRVFGHVVSKCDKALITNNYFESSGISRLQKNAFDK